MTDPEQEEIARLVRASFAPVQTAGAPERDLWTDVARRIDAPAQVPHVDWVLFGVLVGFAFVFPGLIPYLLYHL